MDAIAALVSAFLGTQSSFASLIAAAALAFIAWRLMLRYARLSPNVTALLWFSEMTSVWTKRNWYFVTYLLYFLAYAVVFRLATAFSGDFFRVLSIDEGLEKVMEAVAAAAPSELEPLVILLQNPETFGPVFALLVVLFLLRAPKWDTWFRTKIQQFAAIPKRVEQLFDLLARANFHCSSDGAVKDLLPPYLNNHYGTPVDRSIGGGQAVYRYTQVVAFIESWRQPNHRFHHFYRSHKDKIEKEILQKHKDLTAGFANAMMLHEQMPDQTAAPNIGDWERDFSEALGQAYIAIAAGLVYLTTNGYSVFNILAECLIETRVMMERVIADRRRRMTHVAVFSVSVAVMGYYAFFSLTVILLGLAQIPAIPDEDIGTETMIVWMLLFVSFLFSVAYWPSWVALKRMMANVERGRALVTGDTYPVDWAKSVGLSVISFAILTGITYALWMAFTPITSAYVLEKISAIAPYLILVGAASGMLLALMERKTERPQLSALECIAFFCVVTLFLVLVFAVKRPDVIGSLVGGQWAQVPPDMLREFAFSALIAAGGLLIMSWLVVREHRRNNLALSEHAHAPAEDEPAEAFYPSAFNEEAAGPLPP